MNGLPTPLTEQGDTIVGIWFIFLVGAAIVGALIAVLLLIILIRYRRRDDRLPEQVHYHIGLEVAYTVLPFLVIVGLFVITLTSLSEVEATQPDPDLVVDVIAFQWQWQFHYPDTDITISQPDDQNPPVLVVPQNAVVQFNLESRDVIHSFWVPGFLTKRDIIPGSPGMFQATVTGEPGTYGAVCAEYCGLHHTTMRFDIQILEPAEFDRWVTDWQGQNP